MPLPAVIHWMSPAPDAALVPEGIAVLHLSRADDRDRLDPAMRVIRESGLVLFRPDRLEVVEEQERVEMVERGGPDAPPKMDPRPFHHRLRRDDPLDRPDHPARSMITTGISRDVRFW